MLPSCVPRIMPRRLVPWRAVQTKEEEQELEDESVPVQQYRWLCSLDVATSCAEDGSTASSGACMLDA